MIMRWLRGLLGTALIGLGVLFALAFEARYWRWRDCFNELGRCDDAVSQDVYLEQAGLVFGAAYGTRSGREPSPQAGLDEPELFRSPTRGEGKEG